MIVFVQGQEVRIGDADNLEQLKLVAVNQSDRSLGQVLQTAGLGTIGSEVDGLASEALLRLEELRRRASAVATAPEWDAAWNTMIVGARKAGWVIEEGTVVRAHIERTQSMF